MRRGLTILGIVLTLSACALTLNPRVIQYEAFPRSAKPDDYPLEIFEEKDINRPYKTIGLVQVTARRTRDVAEVIEVLKAEARRIGGDALVSLQQQPLMRGAFTGQVGSAGYREDLWIAKVVVWQ